MQATISRASAVRPVASAKVQKPAAKPQVNVAKAAAAAFTAVVLLASPVMAAEKADVKSVVCASNPTAKICLKGSFQKTPPLLRAGRTEARRAPPRGQTCGGAALPGAAPAPAASGAMAGLLGPSVCKIDTELTIPAPPEAVWAVFGDFANWGDWNDFMVLPVPPEREGKACRVAFRLDGGCIRHSVHDPEVQVLQRDAELRWRDYRGPLFSLFFRGSHWWTLQRLPGGHTRFVHGAEMAGLALPFLAPTMAATRRGYERFNQQLADEVARRARRRAGKAAAAPAPPQHGRRCRAAPLPRALLFARVLPPMAAYGGAAAVEGLQIFVSLRRGKEWPPATCDVRVSYDETVSALKAAAAAKLGVRAADQLQLFWHKRELTAAAFDARTLRDMNIHTGFTLRGYDLVRRPSCCPAARWAARPPRGGSAAAGRAGLAADAAAGLVAAAGARAHAALLNTAGRRRGGLLPERGSCSMTGASGSTGGGRGGDADAGAATSPPGTGVFMPRTLVRARERWLMQQHVASQHAAREWEREQEWERGAQSPLPPPRQLQLQRHAAQQQAARSPPPPWPPRLHSGGVRPGAGGGEPAEQRQQHPLPQHEPSACSVPLGGVRAPTRARALSSPGDGAAGSRPSAGFSAGFTAGLNAALAAAAGGGGLAQDARDCSSAACILRGDASTADPGAWACAWSGGGAAAPSAAAWSSVDSTVPTVCAGMCFAGDGLHSGGGGDVMRRQLASYGCADPPSPAMLPCAHASGSGSACSSLSIQWLPSAQPAEAGRSSGSSLASAWQLPAAAWPANSSPPHSGLAAPRTERSGAWAAASSGGASLNQALAGWPLAGPSMVDDDSDAIQQLLNEELAKLLQLQQQLTLLTGSGASMALPAMGLPLAGGPEPQAHVLPAWPQPQGQAWAGGGAAGGAFGPPRRVLSPAQLQQAESRLQLLQDIEQRQQELREDLMRLLPLVRELAAPPLLQTERPGTMPFDLISGRFIAEKSNIWRDCTDGQHDWVREHVLEGATLNTADHCGDPPLVLAAGGGHLSCVKLLLEEGADIEQRNVMRETPLIRAAHNGHLAVVEFLLQAGADAGALDLVGALRAPPAARSAAAPPAAAQRRLGAAPRQGDNTGLHWAAMRGHVEVVRLLLAGGADRQARNKQGAAPVELCQPLWSLSWRFTQAVLLAGA
ncbi:Alpha-latrocrustotoxin-a [Scenedesmus sp. PABB004]|nr:Alpha-latrocrustotoxin-a [Scenedesmus sp. PABB004]